MEEDLDNSNEILGFWDERQIQIFRKFLEVLDFLEFRRF